MIRSIRNSLVFGLGTSLLAFAGGVYLAWVTERTNIPLKKAIYGSILIPLIVPGLLTTIGWIMMFSRRLGLVNMIAGEIFGFDQPLEIYNMPGMIWVLGTDQIPLSFLLLSASFRSMDPALEEAAVISGTGIVRTTFRITFWKGTLDFLAFMPIAIPGLVLGIAILWLYLTLPIPIYGTLWILLIAYVIKYLPYGMRACSNSMNQIQKELEEASEISGASWLYTFTRVLLPLLLPGFVAGWIYVITHSFRELSRPSCFIAAEPRCCRL
jgi:ABC-type Fe3+ transport system permease subunit